MTTVSITKSAKNTNKVVQIACLKNERLLVTRIDHLLVSRNDDLIASKF